MLGSWIWGDGSRRGLTGLRAGGNAVLGGVCSLERLSLRGPREVAVVKTSTLAKKRGAKALGPGGVEGKRRDVGSVNGGRGLRGWRFGCCKERN